MKILAIVGLFVCMYLPSLVVLTVVSIDFQNRENYTVPVWMTTLLSLCNSVFSPFVYVWRYPECRYKFLIY